jgi:hypothetical protein
VHPQDRLEICVAEFEKAFRVHSEVGDNAHAPTGEPYVIIVCGGLKEEGADCPAFATTPQRAIEMWAEAIARHAQPFHRNASARLYWRTRPALDSELYLPVGITDPAGGLTLWQVYSRLLISDKPIIQSARQHAA